MIAVGCVKKLVFNAFGKGNDVFHFENLQPYLKLTSCIKIQSITIAKIICRI